MSSLNGLLQILNHQHPEDNLTLDSRTLLKKKDDFEIELMGEGEFCYFEIKKGLSHFLDVKDLTMIANQSDQLQLMFNIDGLPLLNLVM